MSSASGLVEDAKAQLRSDVQCLMGLNEAKATGPVDPSAFSRARTQIKQQLVNFRRAALSVRLSAATNGNSLNNSFTSPVVASGSAVCVEGPASTLGGHNKPPTTEIHRSAKSVSTQPERSGSVRPTVHALPPAVETTTAGVLRKPVLHPVDHAAALASMKLRRGQSSKERRGTKADDLGVTSATGTIGKGRHGREAQKALQPLPTPENQQPVIQLETMISFVKECDEQAAQLLRLGLCKDAHELFLDSADADVQTLRLVAEAVVRPVGLHPKKTVDGFCSPSGSPAVHHGRGRDNHEKGRAVPLPDEQLPLAVQAYHRVVNHDIISLVINFYETLNNDPYMDTIQQTVINASCQIESIVQLMYDMVSVPGFLAGNTPAVFENCLVQGVKVGEFPIKDLLAVREEGVPAARFPDGSLRQEKLYRVAELGYHLIFNGTIYVYEMNMYLLRRVQNCVASKRDNGSDVEPSAALRELYRMCINHVSACIKLCETHYKTLYKLATVKFLPWRLQMFDFVMQCFEQMGQYTEAFQVAQQAANSVRFIQELEFMDPVPPPVAWLKVLEGAVHHTMLQVMRYGWYEKIANAMRHHSSRLGAGPGADTSGGSLSAASPHATSSSGTLPGSSGGIGAPASSFVITPELASVAIAHSIPLPVPRSGRELLDVIWRVIEKSPLPSTSTKKSEDEALKELIAATASGGRGNKKGGAPPVGMEQVEALMAAHKHEETTTTQNIARQFQQHVIPFLVGILVLQSVEEEVRAPPLDVAPTPAPPVSPSFSQETPFAKAVALPVKSPGRSKESNQPPPFVLCFQGLRQCAVEALEILLQYMSIAYFIDPHHRYELLRQDASLFPFTVYHKDEHEMEIATAKYFEAAAAPSPEPVEPAGKSQRTLSLKGSKKGKRGGRNEGKGEKSVAALLLALAAPPPERVNIMDDPVFIQTVRIENYFPSLSARYNQVQRSMVGTGRSFSRGDRTTDLSVFEDKQDKTVERKKTKNNLSPLPEPKIVLIPEDELQREFVTLMRVIRYLYSTKREALFYRCCAVAEHLLRGTATGAGALTKSLSIPGRAGPNATVGNGCSAGNKTPSRPESRATYGATADQQLHSTTWNRLVYSGQCMIHMLHALKYSALTVAFQLRTLRTDEVLLQGDYYIPSNHAQVALFLRAGGYHPHVQQLLTQQKQREEAEALGDVSTAHGKKAKEGKGQGGGAVAAPAAVQEVEREVSPPSVPVPPHPYPLVTPLIPAASAMRALANAVGHGGASTRFFPEAPILATTSSISIAAADLYEDVIQMVGRYLLQAATDSIQYRRNERASRIQLGMTAVSFHDPESDDVKALEGESTPTNTMRTTGDHNDLKLSPSVSVMPGDAEGHRQSITELASNAEDHSESSSIVFELPNAQPAMRTEDEVDEEEERAYFHVVVNAIDGMLASGLTNEMSVGEFAINLATSALEDLSCVRDKNRCLTEVEEVSQQTHQQLCATLLEQHLKAAGSEMRKKKTKSKKMQKGMFEECPAPLQFPMSKNPREVQTVKLLERSRLALAFVKVSLTMVTARQKRLNESRSRLGKAPLATQLTPRSAVVNDRRPMLSESAINALQPENGSIGMIEEAALIQFSGALRDCRTYLTRLAVELRYHVACLRAQVSVFVKHQEDIIQLFIRQSNTKVFGAVTAKDSRILCTLLTEDPELPDTAEEEEAKLLNWSFRDPALRALVLLCLANVLPSAKHRRERLESAMDVLMKHGTPTPSTMDNYSNMIIWGFAASTCGKLRATNHSRTAMQVLYEYYLDSSSLAALNEIKINLNDASVAEIAHACKLEINDKVLDNCSEMALLNLSGALQDLSSAEVEASLRRKLRAEKENPPDVHTVAIGSLTDWDWTKSHQLTGLFCAYRSLLALRLLELASSPTAANLILPCINLLFNCLLPCLGDRHYSRHILTPLVAMIYAILDLDDEGWHDFSVQYLALRVLNALKNNLKMAGTAGRGLSLCEESAHPKLQQLLYLAFSQVWNKILEHPNIRQMRYSHYTVSHGMRARYVYTQVGQHIQPEEEEVPAVDSKTSGKHKGEKGGKGSKEAAEAAAIAAEAEARRPPEFATFTGSQFIPNCAQPHLYDQMPLEILELMEELLFNDPVIGATLLNSSINPVSAGKKAAPLEKAAPAPASPSSGKHGSASPAAATTPSGRQSTSKTSLQDGEWKAKLEKLTQPQTLLGIPPIIVEVVTTLASCAGTSAAAVVEVLAKYKDDILLPKVTYRTMEYLIRTEDYATAWQIGLAGVNRVNETQKEIEKFLARLHKGFFSWLALNGYILADSRRIQEEKDAEERRQAVEASKRKSKGRTTSRGSSRGSSTAKKKQKEAPPAEEPEEDTLQFLDLPRVWSSAEDQMLRQMTRALGWIRRRRADRFLHRRVTSFFRLPLSQVRLCLAAVSKLELVAADQKKSYQEERMQYANARSLFCGAGLLGSEGKSGISGAGASTSGPNSARSKKVVVEAKEETEPPHVTLVSQCYKAASIMNNAFFSSHAMRAVSLAVDELRNYTLADIPDALMLAMRDDRMSLPNSAAPDKLDSRPESPSTPGPLTTTVDATQYLNEEQTQKLQELGPMLIRLATELLYSLTSVQRGYCDHRRDTEVVQPAAMKAGLFNCLTEQIHFQGHIPSLFSILSPAGQFEERRIARLAPREHEKAKRVELRRRQEIVDRESKSREACIQAYFSLLRDMVGDFSVVLPLLQPHYDRLAPRETQSTDALSGADGLLLHSLAHRNGEAYCTVDAHEAHATLRRAAMSCPALIHFPFEVPEGMQFTREARIRQLQLGGDLPEEIIVEMVLFLASCLQFFSQREAVQMCVVANELTQDRFAQLLLPIAIHIEDSIGMRTPEMIRSYEAVASGAPIGKSSLATARMNWNWYTHTQSYQRAMQRLSRTLLPSFCMKKDLLLMDNTHSQLTSFGEDNGNAAQRNLLSGGGGGAPQQVIGVKVVLSSYHRTAARLREFREFGSLSECLLEMGQVYLLHRNRTEAESCWLEAVDAALEIPRVLFNWRTTIKKMCVETIGLTRLFTALCTLSSLAMYVYREDQGKAVDCYLLSTTLVRLFFKTGVSLNFPARMFDFSDFNMNDFMVAPYLHEPLRHKVADIAHHLLFLSHQLHQFGYNIYACMMASLTEHFAMRFEQHVQLLTEARLIRAKASACAGNFNSAMRLLKTICHGKHLPTPVLSVLAIPDRYSMVEWHGAQNPVAQGEKKSRGPTSTSAYTAAAQSTESRGNKEGERRIYDDGELPTSPGNVHCIMAFVADCFPNLNMDHLSSPASHGQSAPGAGASSTTPSALLHEAVCERYGTLLSRRIIIAVAEVLITLGGREAAYLWPYDISPSAPTGKDDGGSGRRPQSRDSRQRRGSLQAAQRLSAPTQRTACVEALRAGEYLLEPFLLKESFTAPTSAANPTKVKGGKGNNNPPAAKHNHTKGGISGLELGQDSAELAQLQQRIEESACLRHHAVVLKAAAAAERGFCRSATELLEAELHEFNRLEEEEEEGGVEDGTNSSHHGREGSVHRPSTLSLGNHSVLSNAANGVQTNKKQQRQKFGGGFETQAVPNVPSYLLALSHTHWCRVLHGLTVNYFRLRAFRRMEKAAQQAILLCDRCRDPYSARIFSLYRATALAQTGYLKEAIATVKALDGVTATLAVDAADPFDAWTIMSLEWLRRMMLSPDGAVIDGSPEGLRAAFESLKSHALFCGVLPWYKHGGTWKIKNAMLPVSVWNCHVTVKLHTAINSSAEVRLREFFGRKPESVKFSGGANLLPVNLSESIDLLEKAINAVAPQYDISAHPTQVIESKLLLAQALLCSATFSGGSLTRTCSIRRVQSISRFRPQSSSARSRPQSGASNRSQSRFRPQSGGRGADRTVEGTDGSQPAWKFCSTGELSCQEDTLATLPDARTQRICQLLLDVAESVISSGTHDFQTLRLALLELATLLTRCSPEFSGVAASCTILAHLVFEMTRQVFSGANAFHIYSTDEAMVTDLNALKERFPDFVMAAIQSTVSGVGQLTEQKQVERLNAPISSFYADIMSQEGNSGRRSGRVNENANRNNPTSPEPTQVPVTMQDMAYTFATLQRERGLYVVAPPIEALDHETAVLLLRGYIQEKTTGPNCTYLCYSDDARRQCAKSLTPLRGPPQQGNANRRTNNNAAAALQQHDNIDFWNALVPPVLLKSLPTNFFTATGPDTLGAPKINTVVTQSFASASYDWLREGCETLPGTEDGGMVTLLLSVSPFNDPSLTQPPSIATPADRKKLFAEAKNTDTAANSGRPPSGDRSFKNRLAPPVAALPESRVVYVDAALSDRLQELVTTGTDPDSIHSLRGQWTCVSFELARKVVEELRAQTLQVLHWYQVEESERRKHPVTKKEPVQEGVAGNAAGAGAASPPATAPAKGSGSSSSKNSLGANVSPLTTSVTTVTPAAAHLAVTLNNSLTALQNKLNFQQQQQQQQTAAGSGRKGGQATKGIVLENAASSTSSSGNSGQQSSTAAAQQGGSPPSRHLLCDLSERYKKKQEEVRVAEATTVSRSLDESKSLLLMNLIESIIKSYVARSMADEALMESCIQQLLPTCSLTKEIVEFLASWLSGDGGAAKFFHPGVHAWMRKIANFIFRTRSN